MSRPIRATIDLNALRHNFGVVRTHAPNAKVWSVIKANAYGHGELRAAHALADLTDGFALLEIETAQRVRDAGIRKPILLLEGFFAANEIPRLAALDLHTVIHHYSQLEMLESHVAQHGALPQLNGFVKLNTGMNRLGFTPDELVAVKARLQAICPTASLGLMTHFAEADAANRQPGSVPAQRAVFEHCRAIWGEGCQMVSLANSAAILTHPETHEGWVRPGIMLYGGSPFSDRPASEFDLRPVMSLSSRLISVRTVQAGERVGYGGIFVAERTMRIGTVACGYADGYPRHATTGTPIAVGGKLTRTLGRVSMDMLACDLSDIPDANIGSPVTLWGQGEGGYVDADAVASAAGTISYEMFCGLAQRVVVETVGCQAG